MEVMVAQVDHHFGTPKKNRSMSQRLWATVAMSLMPLDTWWLLQSLKKQPNACAILFPLWKQFKNVYNTNYLLHEMQDRARRLLSKPIKFVHDMQEPFLGTNADGSLAIDQDTCMNDSDGSESDDSQGLNDMSGYALPKDLTSDDSNTLPSPLSHKNLVEKAHLELVKRVPSVQEAASHLPRSKKSLRVVYLSPLINWIPHCYHSINFLMLLHQKCPSPQTLMWERLEAMKITTDDKITVGQYLAHKERKGLRDFLSSASDMTLQTWVYKFLTRENY